MDSQSVSCRVQSQAIVGFGGREADAGFENVGASFSWSVLGVEVNVQNTDRRSSRAKPLKLGDDWLVAIKQAKLGTGWNRCGQPQAGVHWIAKTAYPGCFRN